MKILLTGANGYIGQRLLPVLLDQGHQVACLVRDKNKLNMGEGISKKVLIVEADLLKKETFDNIPLDFDAAYFLVHSMGASSGKFYEMEQQIATNFADLCEESDCKQIIYLSGIANDKKLSKHLASRLNVEDILRKHQVPVTVLRAAIIIGSGSASFEIIRDLVEKLPVMVAPRWIKTQCQPIAIRDVIKYLTGVLGKKESFNRIFDIGGPDILSYKQMMLQYGEVRGLSRTIQVVPFLLPRISSYWLYFITSTTFSIAQSLIESMKNEVIVRLKGIDEIVPIEKTPFKVAVKLAFSKIEQNEVVSSWKDTVYNKNPKLDFSELVQVPQRGVLKDVKVAEVNGNEEQIKNVIWSIGGKNGWYYMDWAWEIRGMLDRIAGGIGMNRGRRNPTELKTGDYLDFWRVLMADKDKGRLLLYAEMKVPGEAWLEFKIDNENGSNKKKFIQTATFRPKGIVGRAYWYTMMPFHLFIFRGMRDEILRRA